MHKNAVILYRPKTIQPSQTIYDLTYVKPFFMIACIDRKKCAKDNFPIKYHEKCLINKMTLKLAKSPHKIVWFVTITTKYNQMGLPYKITRFIIITINIKIIGHNTIKNNFSQRPQSVAEPAHGSRGAGTIVPGAWLRGPPA